MPHDYPDFESFRSLAEESESNILIPIFRRLMSDQITPVLAYRRLVRPDDRLAPSFLLESVEGGSRQGRYSYLGAQPTIQIIARGNEIHYVDDRGLAGRSMTYQSDDPLAEMHKITSKWKLAQVDGLPDFSGGWVGYAAYDTIRYLEGEKLNEAPTDDRELPDLNMCLYRDIVAFDHVQKTVLVVTHVLMDEHDSVEAAYEQGVASLDALVNRVETPPDVRPELAVGEVDLQSPPPALPTSNMGEGGYQNAVEKCKEYIAAGDIFQVVPSQRFELQTKSDPFDIYRALRVVNPSPYMFYLQFGGGMLVGSSPEILCRVKDNVVVSRPLAGTRRRGRDGAEDLALEEELLADPKEQSEHIMLVDLGRNDVGRVAEPGTIELPEIMVIERYSHVMHISSTVTGRLRDGCNCWDALRVSLPVGTVSGAPKVRAMQIIDELEPHRRGPYAGAVGVADFAGNMDMAIALRTMVVMPNGDGWTVHIQAGAGIVADSVPDLEHQETVNKAAAMAKAVQLAENAFG